MNLLERLKQLEAEATSGPWRAVDYYDTGFITDVVYPIKGHHVSGEDVVFGDERTVEVPDLLFIAEMRNALPKLLAVVEGAKGMLQDEEYKWYKKDDCLSAGGVTGWDIKHQELEYALAALEDNI